MKQILINILNEYLKIFPEEKERQLTFSNYLEKSSDKQIADWNNFEGHIVASGFIYLKRDNKFLVVYHNDFKRYLYPGGHADKNDRNPLETAKREVIEETGIKKIEELKITKDPLIPIDIDTHIIGYNERLNLPKHYHFDFRYVFIIDEFTDITIDTEELSDYKWIDIKEIDNIPNCSNIVLKMKKYLN